MNNISKEFSEQQINHWINNGGLHNIISDNSNITIYNNVISGGTTLVNNYNNSNIILYVNNCSNELYNVIGSQNGRITNLLHYKWISVLNVDILPEPTYDELNNIYKCR